MPQAKVAAAAGLSAGYYSEIENSKRPPPPERTAERLAGVLALNPQEAELLLASAESERAAFDDAGELPSDVCTLIRTIRRNASKLPPTLVAALQSTVEGAAM